MDELMKHPYHSSKFYMLTCIEKPGTGIFLMKERAKVYKAQTDRKKHELSKRLYAEERKDAQEDMGLSMKRKKLADGSSLPVSINSKQSIHGPQKQKLGSLKVKFLSFQPNTLQTLFNTSLDLLIVYSLNAFLDQRCTINLDTFNELLKNQLLVLTLDEREVTLNAVEVRTVWYIEDRSHL